MEIINKRGGLCRTKAAIAGGRLKVGFIGGSITNFSNYRSWTEHVIGYIMQRYPELRISVVNAGIGGTSSDYGVFRAERDITSKSCDLVFVEYAVNDLGLDANYRAKSREGLIRKLKNAGCDVVLVYTYSNPMYEEMMNEKIPSTVADFEVIAEHYNISSVWMGKYALDKVRNGLLRVDEWLPDGLHPAERGSLEYALAVCEYLDSEFVSESAVPTPMPTPLYKNNLENCRAIPFDEINFAKPWRLRDNYQPNIRNEYLDTCAVGARLKYEFNGTGTCILYMFGSKAADL